MKYTTALLITAVSILAFCCDAVAADGARMETVSIEAPGGIRLATDLYQPESVPAPVVLIRTPYGRDGMAFLGEALSAEGYVVAVQDVRGKYGSTGEHEPFRNERTDGLASLKWIAAQPWCNGKVGMWGSSYSGFAALVLADARVPSFQSIFSISGWLDARKVIRPGGANHLLLNLPWMLSQQGRQQRSTSEFDMDTLFRHTPLRDALRSVGISNASWENPSWIEDLTSGMKMGDVPRPIFHVTGWHDMVYRATLDAWKKLDGKSRKLQKLAVGPWYHNQFLIGDWEVGDRSFGHASGFGVDEVVALTLRWFDATLKGEKNGIMREPPVSFFVMGQNAWHQAQSWPPPIREARPERWYLDSGGKANGSSGDGFLSRKKPARAESDRFRFDPMDPVPTLGGANFFYLPELLGVRDQREISRRNDVLVYTSAPMDEETQITGQVKMRLHVATSGNATDFTAKLVIVEPDGYERIVEEGVIRTGSGEGAVSTPGEPFTVEIDLGHTAVAVPAGHRIRVEISSSNFPKYDRNPNTGADPFLATEFRMADQTIFHTGERLSWIALPVQRKSLAATARGMEPLVVPGRERTAEAIKVEGDDASALLARGRQELEDGEEDQAIATLKRAVELRPDGSEDHHWLGRAYLAKLNKVSMLRKLKWARKVKASFIRAVELAPESVDARTSLANFYFQAPGIAGGDHNKGMEQVDQVRRLDPKAGHLLMAGVFAGDNRMEEAKKEYRAAIQAEPSNPLVYYRLGLLHQADEEWTEAFDAFETAVKEADDMMCLYQVGRTAIFSGQRLDRAKDAYEIYIARKPEGPGLPSVASAHWRLGMVWEKMGDKGKARAQYETALQLEPGMEQARESLESL